MIVVEILTGEWQLVSGHILPEKKGTKADTYRLGLMVSAFNSTEGNTD